MSHRIGTDGRTECCGAYTSISIDDGVEYCKKCYEAAGPHVDGVFMDAPPYAAQQCTECGEWVYVMGGPFAEDNDPTKPMSDWLHWEKFHAGRVDDAPVIGFPFFHYNEVPVRALWERHG